jgi:hypothetical protein
VFRPFVPVVLAVPVPAQLPPPGSGPDWLLDPAPYVATVVRDDGTRRLVLDNGLVRWTLQTEPAALIGIEHRTAGRQLLRAAAPLGSVVVDGQELWVGGLQGQPNRAFLLPEWLPSMAPDPRALMPRGPSHTGPIVERFPWRRSRPIAVPAPWPPDGKHVRQEFFGLGVAVTLNLELYDGLPLVAHWLEVKNERNVPIELDTFTALRLPIVEAESRVEAERLGVRLPDLCVETDMAFHAMTGADGSSHAVRWIADPDYATQVNYEQQTRCLLEVKPEVGPARTLRPGETFTTFRTFVLAPDRCDRERQSLAQRRMYRTLAPWSLENPLMMHVRSADPAAVREAIDQCAAVGFEMAILTFGSAFDIEDDSKENLARWKELADYAHERSVQLGGYSLLASRRIEPDEDNCIDKATGRPGGGAFGHAPALASRWGQRYFAKLRRFYEITGFDLLEHDGSYPGDHDAAVRPPLQKGWADSRFVQFGIVADFYRWCRERGIYLNVPDWYFLQGSNKTGMGYRETNWSLPREQQVLHTRQNLFDGTRDKTPTMGWMFVPLTEYHGGGPAATIEPLALHLPHYERMLASNLGYGAQACWRGPRLFDAPPTRDLVKRQVDWFKRHRAILEADVIHGSSRRACGQELDWVLHADPRVDPPAMLVVHNPTTVHRTQEIPLDLYFAGLVDHAVARGADELGIPLVLDRFARTRLLVQVPAGGSVWYTLR